VVVATKDDPYASLSLFEQPERKPRRRARSATPSVISDLTPRDNGHEDAMAAATVTEAPAAISFDQDDPLARARQRRLKAGYAQATA